MRIAVSFLILLFVSVFVAYFKSVQVFARPQQKVLFNILMMRMMLKNG